MSSTPTTTDPDVVVIGGGQSALAAGQALARRAQRSFVLLDAAARPGGAWPERWASLRLFSPAEHSSLPGRPMGAADGEPYPPRDHVVAYLADYERRYGLRVVRPVRATAVERVGERLEVAAADGRTWAARAVISATGHVPWTPAVPGADRFAGAQLHAADYRAPEPFSGRRVLVVGGGNSGAQVLAELSEVAETTWVTDGAPRFMADDVDGRVLFAAATERHDAQREGRAARVPPGLGDVVVVDAVKDARARGALAWRPAFDHLVPGGAVWRDGTFVAADAIVWCTGFRPALEHLRPLGVLDAQGRVAVEGARAVAEPRLHLLGYGDWTGFASATLIGVGRSARAAVAEIDAALGAGPGA